jgi:hypothetical protein
MAILKDKDIRDILKNRPTKPVWDDAADQKKLLQMHTLGFGLTDYIRKIDGLEREKLSKLRQQYAKSNRDLFARSLRPMDNIWDARGGGVYYNTTEGNSKRLKAMLTDVYNGFSLRTFVKNFIRPRLFDDPMGIIFMEVSNQNPNLSYPTYKASTDIFDAKLKGRAFEYLILNTDAPDIKRVIDDQFDRLIKITDGKIEMLKGQQFPVYPNFFGHVPAVVISDVPKCGMDGAFESPIQELIELAHEFLVDGSIRKIYKFRHGFPKEWRYPLMCGDCKGTGHVSGNECAKCNGTGKGTVDDPNSIWIFEKPDADNPELGEKGGFVNPSIEYLDSSLLDLDNLEAAMFETHWGTQRVEKNSKDSTKPETATARYIDMQPVNNRLSLYAATFEGFEAFITDHIGQINFQTSFKGASVSYGRRFMIESPDELLKKYGEGCTKELAISTLDDLYMDYLESKFQNQPIELERQIKLMRVEPFFHMSLSALASSKLVEVDISLYNKKMLFGEWVKTISPMDVNNKTEEELRAMLDLYVQGRKIEIQKPQPAQPAAAAA